MKLVKRHRLKYDLSLHIDVVVERKAAIREIKISFKVEYKKETK